MNLRRIVAGLVLVLAALAIAVPVLARTRTASIGNFWYEDDATHSRTKLVAQVGDQITFTVREGVYPPHTVDVDELNIHSPDLLLGDTYTTPVISRVGNFKLYCRPHEARGHFTRLIVQSLPKATPAPTARPGAQATAPPSGVAKGTPRPAVTASPAASLAPVGVRKATPEELSRRPTVAADPNSLDALIGRTRTTRPWTDVLWQVAAAAIAAVGAGIFALWRNTTLAASTDSAPLPPDRPRSTKRSPRSSSPKASGSARTSRGRRR